MNMKKLPIISIVTVSYNAASTIEKTILSVINQTYSYIEYIIIDGGSTDGTVDIIKKYADKIAYWVSEPDKGIYDAMNKGGCRATGQYIQFLNAGDWLENSFVIERIFEKKNFLDADVFYGDMIIRRIDGIFYATAQSLSHFKDDFPLFHPSTFIARSVFVNHLFDVSYRISADFKLLRDIYYANGIFIYVSFAFTNFDGVYGLSSSKCALEIFEERERIYGNTNSIMWYLKYSFFYMKLKIKELLKFVLKFVCPFYYRKIVENHIPYYLKRIS